MIHDLRSLAEHDVSWLAIRQPAVMRLLEAELGGVRRRRVRAPASSWRAGCSAARPAWAISGSIIAPSRTALGDVRAGRCDRAMVRSLRDQIEELPVALTQREQDAVATVIAAIIYAVLDESVRDLGDTLVA